jgi:hypothetical protein
MATEANAVNVRGARSCGEWIQSHAEANSWTALVEESWVIGYLSGMAMTSNTDFVHGTDNQSIFLWISNYCQANPLNDVADASDELARQLVKRKGL